MPNWCENRVSIDCSNPEIMKEFRETLCTNDVLDFFKIVPLGLGNNEDGTPKWDYTTACDKWGTKWQLDTQEGSRDRGSFNGEYADFNFDTAWGPPNKIYEALVAWFDDREADVYISWFYDEPGMQFAGYLNNE